ncbi:MAG TPA: branched-chain-amino-acid transaminase [Gemmataceae bacterium]|jgi:branched-chain amino acid aminotransferase|nr:branched-chain-amino-acid transaminase [Gemmataceae bacterium]
MSTTRIPQIYINGKFYPKPDAKINVYDHGLLYGDGVFEGLRIYAGKIFKLKEHVDRLFESARAIKLEIPLTHADMMEAIQKTVDLNQKDDGYIRPVVTRGAGYLGLDPRKCSDPQVIIIVDDITMYPDEMYEHGMEIVTVATIRNHPNALNPRIKSLNYLNNILAKLEGQLAGCSEALMLNQKGEIAECSGDNVFLVRRGQLETPSMESGILDGITRTTVIDLAKAAKIDVREMPLTRHDLYISDECFLTGSAAEIIPVTKCDARIIGGGKPGPVTKQLREAFQRLVRG